MRFRATVVWTQWYLGVWWWPVPKDLTVGICLGPLQLMWRRHGW